MNNGQKICASGKTFKYCNTEFAEFGEFFNQEPRLLCALRASAVQSPSSAAHESLKTPYFFLHLFCGLRHDAHSITPFPSDSITPISKPLSTFRTFSFAPPPENSRSSRIDLSSGTAGRH
jgi:hypothetical protein